MKKRFGWLAAVFVFVLILAGCGSKESSGGPAASGSVAPAGSVNPSGTAGADSGKSDRPSYEGLTVRLGVQGRGGLFGIRQKAGQPEDYAGPLSDHRFDGGRGE